MTITAIKDFKIKESYTKLIQSKLWSYLWEGIYKPLFEIMQIKPQKAQNSIDVISEALREGKIYYTDGGFKAKGKFTNAQSLQLQKWGAKWDKYKKMYKIEQEKLPQQLQVTIAQSQTLAKQQIQLVQDYLKEVQANMPYMIDSMVFNNEVITILDDAGNEVKKNVKHLNVIEPELSIEQKREIARTYTNNMRDYVIKDFAQERIPEMRKKIQELVLKGYRPDRVQELLEKEYGIAGRKAKFLAQNETSIMLSEYKRVTYQEMGFDKFIWKTITDGRERELHKQLNNTTWSYDNPPVIDERTGQTGLPGQTYNCRCEAIPFRSGSEIKIKGRISEKNSKDKISSYLIKHAKNAADENIEWITVKGNHIPIKKGQTKEEAVKEFIENKNTIAGVKKGKPMSFKKANSGNVNPNYNKGGGYENNCQTCVAVFEARLRGYDIEAAPYDESNAAMRKLALRPWSAYKTEAGNYPKILAINTTSPKGCEQWLKKNIHKGSRYAFGYGIRGAGHKHIIQVQKGLFGDIQFYDPQNGERLKANEVLNEVRFTTLKYGKISKTPPLIFRIDNTTLNTELLTEIMNYK